MPNTDPKTARSVFLSNSFPAVGPMKSTLRTVNGPRSACSRSRPAARGRRRPLGLRPLPAEQGLGMSDISDAVDGDVAQARPLQGGAHRRDRGPLAELQPHGRAAGEVDAVVEPPR